MKSLIVEITHIGEDYAGIELNGEFMEISLSEAKNIKSLMKIIKEIALNSSY